MAFAKHPRDQKIIDIKETILWEFWGLQTQGFY